MVEKILNNTTPYGKNRASHEGSLHSSTLKHYQCNFTLQLIIEIQSCFKMNSPPLKSRSRVNYVCINNFVAHYFHA